MEKFWMCLSIIVFALTMHDLYDLQFNRAQISSFKAIVNMCLITTWFLGSLMFRYIVK